MPQSSTTVTATLTYSSGAPAANARVVFRLNASDIEWSEGMVVPQTREYFTDAEGKLSVDLWPNTQGMAGTYYDVIARDEKNRKLLDGTIVVPDAETVALHELWELDAPDNILASQELLGDIIANKDSALASATEAAHWAKYPEDAPVPEGNGSEFSSLHHQRKSEAAQLASENARDASQTARTQSQAAKTLSEEARDDSIDARDASQAAQALSEGARDASISARNASQAAQAASESARDASQLARDESEDAQAASELARDQSVSARNASQTAQGLSEDAQDASENARDASQAAQALSEGARDAAISARNAAQTSESNAADSKTAAAASETRAEEWAEKDEDVEVTPSKYSAKHWALKAMQVSTGPLIYRGAWDASTGAFPADPIEGDFYKVSVAGFIASETFNVGDHIVYNGEAWDHIDNTESVTSVGGYVGAVTANQLLAAVASVSGAGGGLDADDLDGQSGAFYRNASNMNAGTLPSARLSGQYNVSVSGSAASVAGTNVGVTGNVSPTSVADLSSPSDWAALPVGASLFISNDVGVANGAPEDDHGYFTKLANRNVNGGWAGLFKPRTSNTLYFGEAATSASYATWYAMPTEGENAAFDQLDVNGDASFGGNMTFNTVGATFIFESDESNRDLIRVTRDGVQSWIMYVRADGSLDFDPKSAGNEFRVGGELVWNAGNGGAGSGMDSDKLDGLEASELMRTAQSNTNLTEADDLNSLETPGIYAWNGAATAPANTPPGLEEYGMMLVDMSGIQPIQLAWGGTDGHMAMRRKNSGVWAPWTTVWTSASHGSGSGLDADLVDGWQLDSILAAIVTASVSGAATIEPGTGRMQKLTLTGDTTLSISDHYTAVRGLPLYIEVTQDATGGHSLSFDTSNILSPGGVFPAVSSAANAVDLYEFLWDGNQYLFRNYIGGLQ